MKPGSGIRMQPQSVAFWHNIKFSWMKPGQHSIAPPGCLLHLQPPQRLQAGSGQQQTDSSLFLSPVTHSSRLPGLATVKLSNAKSRSHETKGSPRQRIAQAGAERKSRRTVIWVVHVRDRDLPHGVVLV
mmetsp:Transcript_15005/g.56910  ORF Transcript_15005/g.56910 Transcript_15005/m.56910 type:complete len:129 (+) Transcript_15005:549-935(+)